MQTSGLDGEQSEDSTSQRISEVIWEQEEGDDGS